MPSATDRKKGLNHCMDNVSLQPVEITQTNFAEWIESSIDFEPQNLGMFGEKESSLWMCYLCIETYDKNIKLNYFEGRRKVVGKNRCCS